MLIDSLSGSQRDCLPARPQRRIKQALQVHLSNLSLMNGARGVGRCADISPHVLFSEDCQQKRWHYAVWSCWHFWKNVTLLIEGVNVDQAVLLSIT